MIKLSKHHLSFYKEGSLQLVRYWWINQLELAAGCVQVLRNFFNFSGQLWFIEVLLTLSDKVVIIKSTFALSRAIFLVLSLGFTLPSLSFHLSTDGLLMLWNIWWAFFISLEKQGVTTSLNSVLIKLFIKRKRKEIKRYFLVS